MNQIDLKGKIAIITGGARGIGYAIAERMLDSGASVCLWDIDEERLLIAKSALEKKGRTEIIKVELVSEEEVQQATDKVQSLFGKIDILVNNAGITGGNALTWELDTKLWRKVIEVNLIAPFITCHAVVPKMIANGYGRIINVASIAGKEGEMALIKAYRDADSFK